MANKIEVDRGTTYAITGTYTDSDGAAVDITNSAVRFTVKSTEWDSDADDSDALITKSGTITNGPAGEWLVSLSPVDTYQDKGSYYYDVKIDVDGDASDIKLLDKGRFILNASPTNRTS